MLSRVAFWVGGRGGGGNKSTPVKHKHVLLPPACSSLLLTEALPGSWPGRYMRRERTQSVRYHSLFSTISFRLQGSYVSATSQARLHGVLGRTSMYEPFLVVPLLWIKARIINTNKPSFMILQPISSKFPFLFNSVHIRDSSLSYGLI